MMHTEMEVYKTSMQRVKAIYDMTVDFPTDEKWGLISQMKRATISIPSNIAEGCGRRSKKELSNFLNISLGSVAELSTQIDIAVMLGFAKDRTKSEACRALALSVKRQLVGLLRSMASPSEN